MNNEIRKDIAKDDIEKIKGNNKILLVAPHGNKKDDKNTGDLTREIAKKINCYAIINEVYKKPPKIENPQTGEKGEGRPEPAKNFINLNRCDQVEEYLKQGFLEPLVGYVNKIIGEHGSSIILWIHGIDDDNIKNNSVENSPVFDVLLGAGQGNPDKFTAEKHTVKKLIDCLRDNGNGKKIVAALAERDSNYCGNYKNTMNQYFRLKKYPLSQVQSIQLEIKFHGFRDPGSIPDAADAFSGALLKLINPKDTLMAKPDTNLVDQAYQELADIFSRHFENAMMEAGQYLIDKFYGGDIEKARKKEPIDGESFFQLISRLHAKGSGGPSKSWVYNAIKLVVESHDLKDFQTYGKLNLSHKILLLPIKDRKQKEQLIEDAVEKNLTVVQFKEEIKKVKGGKSKTRKATKSLTRIIGNPKILFNDEYKSATAMGSLLERDIDYLEDLLTRAKRKKTEIDGKIKDLNDYSENYGRLTERISEAIKKIGTRSPLARQSVKKGLKFQPINSLANE